MSRIKILAVTDQVVESLHSANVKDRFGDVDFIISCGDLPYGYLDYLMTILGKPLYYVHGNHDKDHEYTESGRRSLGVCGVWASALLLLGVWGLVLLRLTHPHVIDTASL